MNFVRKVRNYIFFHAVYAGLFNSWDDERFIRLLFKRNVGYEPDLDNPKTFNEKMQWLKLHDRKPEYTAMVDKYEAKRIIAEKVGEQYVIPTLGVWDKVEDIDFDSLPTQFVLKTTHDCGGVVICKDKASFDIAAAKKKLSEHMKVNYYYTSREWPYKNAKPRIIAEELLSDDDGSPLEEYNLFCSFGEPLFSMHCYGDKLQGGIRYNDYYMLNGERMPLKWGNETMPSATFQQFDAYSDMIEKAKRLSKEMAFLRVDFYLVDGKAVLGELTMYNWGGVMPIEPPEWDRKLGDLIQLPTTQ